MPTRTVPAMDESRATERRVFRAQLILYAAMAVLIAVPFLVLWLVRD